MRCGRRCPTAVCPFRSTADGWTFLDPTLGSGIRLIGLMSPVHHIQNTLGLLMFGKVFDRHPALEVVSAEHDGGWIAHYGYRMEQMYERHHNWLGQGIALERTPTEYLSERVWYTFQKDPIAVETRHRVGVKQPAISWVCRRTRSPRSWVATPRGCTG